MSFKISEMLSQYKTVSGIKPDPVLTFTITSGRLREYLINQVLGFPVGVVFTRWTGVSGLYNYVRMEVTFAGQNLIMANDATDYADRVILAQGAGLKMNKAVLDQIEPFKYVDISNWRAKFSQEKKNELNTLGLNEQRLDEIAYFREFKKLNDQDAYVIYLCPESIITKMLTEANDGVVPGSVDIREVHGTTSDSITWVVEVREADSQFMNRLNFASLY